jgi:hypothetical protein
MCDFDGLVAAKARAYRVRKEIRFSVGSRSYPINQYAYLTYGNGRSTNWSSLSAHHRDKIHECVCCIIVHSSANKSGSRLFIDTVQRQRNGKQSHQQILDQL